MCIGLLVVTIRLELQFDRINRAQLETFTVIRCYSWFNFYLYQEVVLTCVSSLVNRITQKYPIIDFSQNSVERCHMGNVMRITLRQRQCYGWCTTSHAPRHCDVLCHWLHGYEFDSGQELTEQERTVAAWPRGLVSTERRPSYSLVGRWAST